MDEFRKAIKSCGNGTIFVDEAYDLDPFGDFKGKPIVAELLNCSENMRDCISFILAGYEGGPLAMLSTWFVILIFALD